MDGSLYPQISTLEVIEVDWRCEIRAGYEEFKELDRRHKALNEDKAAASIALGKKLIDARDHRIPQGQFDAFLKELHRDIGISRRMAYYHIDNARSALPCATVAQMGFRGVQKYLRLRDGITSGGEVQTSNRKGGAKKLIQLQAQMKQTLEVLSDVCAAGLTDTENMQLDAEITSFLKEVGHQWRAFRVTAGLAA